jgi:hypothetical protein
MRISRLGWEVAARLLERGFHGKYLGDNTMATTILDRLMHRSHLLEFEGKSYRLKEAATRFAQNTLTSS